MLDIMLPPVQPISADTLRSVMRRVPSPVTVITMQEAEEIHGVTIGSFTSVSLEPPLVSFNIQQATTLHDRFTEVGRTFAINVLSAEQGYLSDHFSIPERAGTAHFSKLTYDLTGGGLPILDSIVVALVCEVYAYHSVGDHSLVIGLVTDVRRGDEAAVPLLYYDRSYRTVTM